MRHVVGFSWHVPKTVVMKATTAPTSTRIIATGIIFLLVALLTSANTFAGGGKLTFKDSKLISGTKGANGAVYEFPKVNKDLDARIKINDRSSSQVYLKNIDASTSGFDKAWQPEIGYGNGSAPGAVNWWMEFEISFYEKGTTKAANIEEFDLSAIDIDGNGHLIREYVSFYSPKSYVVEATSLLGISTLTNLLNGVLSNIGVRFEGPTRNYVNIDTGGTAVMTTVKYQNIQKFTVRLGAIATGASGAAERMYSLYYQDFKYSEPLNATLPVDLKNFDARVAAAKVNLEWATENETNFSHFVLQRSSDGKDFSDVAMIMSTAESMDYKYNYAESFKYNPPAVLYYRLKMVDIDGTFKYSSIRVVRMNVPDQNVAISTFPNPVTSELRITVPSAWQNRPVTYDVVNISGNIVRRQATDHASQTETISMNDLKAGIYIIRLKSGNEAAVQQVVKK